MNNFTYKIYDNVYKDIISGKKTIEFRLLNEKSGSIQIGDEIKFEVVENETKLVIVNVLDKYIYKNIDELWNSKEVLNNFLNYTKDEFINAFYNIFGKEKVINSKIIGFKFEIKEIGVIK